MNLILVDQDEIDPQGSIVLQGRRAEHIAKVIQPQPNDQLKIGVQSDNIFLADVVSVQATPFAEVELNVDLTQIFKIPPPPIPLVLVVALPRPKVARRLVQLCAECGIKELHFIHSFRVEKSYWQSPLLQPPKIEKQIQLGLEQSIDTIAMKVELHSRFKPFVQDVLPQLIDAATYYVAHPHPPQPDNKASVQIDSKTANEKVAVVGQKSTFSLALKDIKLKMKRNEPQLMVIGPEGGFINYEIALLKENGAQIFSLGERIYRTETVVPIILGMLNQP